MVKKLTVPESKVVADSFSLLSGSSTYCTAPLSGVVYVSNVTYGRWLDPTLDITKDLLSGVRLIVDPKSEPLLE